MTTARSRRRWLPRLVGLCAAVVPLAFIGRWAVAVALAAALVGGGLCWWARAVEPRLFGPRYRSSPPQLAEPTAHDTDRHLAFAHALALVAARYLAECQADQDRGR
jgi:hypothetical protein